MGGHYFLRELVAKDSRHILEDDAVDASKVKISAHEKCCNSAQIYSEHAMSLLFTHHRVLPFINKLSLSLTLKLPFITHNLAHVAIKETKSSSSSLFISGSSSSANASYSNHRNRRTVLNQKERRRKRQMPLICSLFDELCHHFILFILATVICCFSLLGAPDQPDDRILMNIRHEHGTSGSFTLRLDDDDAFRSRTFKTDGRERHPLFFFVSFALAGDLPSTCTSLLSVTDVDVFSAAETHFLASAGCKIVGPSNTTMTRASFVRDGNNATMLFPLEKGPADTPEDSYEVNPIESIIFRDAEIENVQIIIFGVHQPDVVAQERNYFRVPLTVEFTRTRFTLQHDQPWNFGVLFAGVMPYGTTITITNSTRIYVNQIRSNEFAFFQFDNCCLARSSKVVISAQAELHVMGGGNKRTEAYPTPFSLVGWGDSTFIYDRKEVVSIKTRADNFFVDSWSSFTIDGALVTIDSYRDTLSSGYTGFRLKYACALLYINTTTTKIGGLIAVTNSEIKTSVGAFGIYPHFITAGVFSNAPGTLSFKTDYGEYDPASLQDGDNTNNIKFNNTEVLGFDDFWLQRFSAAMLVVKNTGIISTKSSVIGAIIFDASGLFSSTLAKTSLLLARGRVAAIGCTIDNRFSVDGVTSSSETYTSIQSIVYVNTLDAVDAKLGSSIMLRYNSLVSTSDPTKVQDPSLVKHGRSWCSALLVHSTDVLMGDDFETMDGQYGGIGQDDGRRGDSNLDSIVTRFDVQFNTIRFNTLNSGLGAVRLHAFYMYAKSLKMFHQSLIMCLWNAMNGAVLTALKQDCAASSNNNCDGGGVSFIMFKDTDVDTKYRTTRILAINNMCDNSQVTSHIARVYGIGFEESAKLLMNGGSFIVSRNNTFGNFRVSAPSQFGVGNCEATISVVGFNITDVDVDGKGPEGNWDYDPAAPTAIIAFDSMFTFSVECKVAVMGGAVIGYVPFNNPTVFNGFSSLTVDSNILVLKSTAITMPSIMGGVIFDRANVNEGDDFKLTIKRNYLVATYTGTDLPFMNLAMAGHYCIGSGTEYPGGFLQRGRTHINIRQNVFSTSVTVVTGRPVPMTAPTTGYKDLLSLNVLDTANGQMANSVLDGSIDIRVDIVQNYLVANTYTPINAAPCLMNASQVLAITPESSKIYACLNEYHKAPTSFIYKVKAGSTVEINYIKTPSMWKAYIKTGGIECLSRTKSLTISLTVKQTITLTQAITLTPAVTQSKSLRITQSKSRLDTRTLPLTVSVPITSTQDLSKTLTMFIKPPPTLTTERTNTTSQTSSFAISKTLFGSTTVTAKLTQTLLLTVTTTLKTSQTRSRPISATPSVMPSRSKEATATSSFTLTRTKPTRSRNTPTQSFTRTLSISQTVTVTQTGATQSISVPNFCPQICFNISVAGLGAATYGTSNMRGVGSNWWEVHPSLEYLSRFPLVSVDKSTSSNFDADNDGSNTSAAATRPIAIFNGFRPCAAPSIATVSKLNQGFRFEEWSEGIHTASYMNHYALGNNAGEGESQEENSIVTTTTPPPTTTTTTETNPLSSLSTTTAAPSTSAAPPLQTNVTPAGVFASAGGELTDVGTSSNLLANANTGSDGENSIGGGGGGIEASVVLGWALSTHVVAVRVLRAEVDGMEDTTVGTRLYSWERSVVFANPSILNVGAGGGGSFSNLTSADLDALRLAVKDARDRGNEPSLQRSSSAIDKKESSSSSSSKGVPAGAFIISHELSPSTTQMRLRLRLKYPSIESVYTGRMIVRVGLRFWCPPPAEKKLREQYLIGSSSSSSSAAKGSSNSNAADDDYYEVPITLIFHPPPPPAKVLPPSLQTAATVTSFLSANMQTLAILGVVSCSKGSSRMDDALAVRSLSPWALDSSCGGALEGNFIVVGVLVVLHGLSVVIVRFFLEREKKRFAAAAEALGREEEEEFSEEDEIEMKDDFIGGYAVDEKEAPLLPTATTTDEDAHATFFSNASGNDDDLCRGTKELNAYKARKRAHLQRVRARRREREAKERKQLAHFNRTSAGSLFASALMGEVDAEVDAEVRARRQARYEKASSWIKAMDVVQFPSILLNIVGFMRKGLLVCGVEVIRSAEFTIRGFGGNGGDEDDEAAIFNGGASSKSVETSLSSLDLGDLASISVDTTFLSIGSAALAIIVILFVVTSIISCTLASRAFHPKFYRFKNAFARKLAWTLIPSGGDDQTIPGAKAFSNVVARFRIPQRWAYLLQWLPFFATIPLTLGIGSSCLPMYALAIGIYVATAIIILVLRPYRTRFLNGFTPLSLAVTATVVAMYAVILESPYNVPQFAVDAVAVVASLQIVFSAISVFVTFLSFLTNYLYAKECLSPKPLELSCAFEVIGWPYPKEVRGCRVYTWTGNNKAKMRSSRDSYSSRGGGGVFAALADAAASAAAKSLAQKGDQEEKTVKKMREGDIPHKFKGRDIGADEFNAYVDRLTERKALRQREKEMRRAQKHERRREDKEQRKKLRKALQKLEGEKKKKPMEEIDDMNLLDDEDDDDDGHEDSHGDEKEDSSTTEEDSSSSSQSSSSSSDADDFCLDLNLSDFEDDDFGFLHVDDEDDEDNSARNEAGGVTGRRGKQLKLKDFEQLAVPFVPTATLTEHQIMKERARLRRLQRREEEEEWLANNNASNVGGAQRQKQKDTPPSSVGSPLRKKVLKKQPQLTTTKRDASDKSGGGGGGGILTVAELQRDDEKEVVANHHKAKESGGGGGGGGQRTHNTFFPNSNAFEDAMFVYDYDDDDSDDVEMNSLLSRTKPNNKNGSNININNNGHLPTLTPATHNNMSNAGDKQWSAAVSISTATKTAASPSLPPRAIRTTTTTATGKVDGRRDSKKKHLLADDFNDDGNDDDTVVIAGNRNSIVGAIPNLEIIVPLGEEILASPMKRTSENNNSFEVSNRWQRRQSDEDDEDAQPSLLPRQRLRGRHGGDIPSLHTKASAVASTSHPPPLSSLPVLLLEEDDEEDQEEGMEGKEAGMGNTNKYGREEGNSIAAIGALPSSRDGNVSAAAPSPSSSPVKKPRRPWDKRARVV